MTHWESQSISFSTPSRSVTDPHGYMQSLPRPDTTDPSSRQPLVAQKENPSQLCVNISCGKSQTILVADVKLKNKKSERDETFSFSFVKLFRFYLVQLQLPRRVNAWGESFSFTSHLRRAKTLNLARTRSQSSLEKQALSEEGASLPGFVGGEREIACVLVQPNLFCLFVGIRALYHDNHGHTATPVLGS